jgi:hypothetical protein
LLLFWSRLLCFGVTVRNNKEEAEECTAVMRGDRESIEEIGGAFSFFLGIALRYRNFLSLAHLHTSTCNNDIRLFQTTTFLIFLLFLPSFI